MYKTDDTVKKTIESFFSSPLAGKLYIIDNSPTDVLKHELQVIIKDERVKYIFNKKNIGYGAGHNIALKETIYSSHFHLVLNPDVYFEADVLDTLYQYLCNNNAIGLLVPKVVYPSGKLQYVCKLIPTPLDLIARLFPKNIFKHRRESFELRFTSYNKVMNVPYLHGCFMFLRCSALKEIGLFDERFFMYPEDIDLTRRMHKKFKTVFYPYVYVVHEHAKSSFKSMRMFVIHSYNMIKYFNKWGWIFDSERRKMNKAVLQKLQEKKCESH